MRFGRAIQNISTGVKYILNGVVGAARDAYPAFLIWVGGRNWDVSFGPVFGKAGTTQHLYVSPNCVFRGQKLMATDTANPAGAGTRITSVLVGQKTQRPLSGQGSLTMFFSGDSLRNEIEWDDCPPNLSIALTVSFIESCTFSATVFGKAVV